MSNIKEKAKEYFTLGINVVPTNEAKAPLVEHVSHYFTNRTTEQEIERYFTSSRATGIGTICGKISGGLEVIDVDTKYDLTGKLWEDLLGLIENHLPELLPSLVIAQTRSGGYHIYYRCEAVKGNTKLAFRSSTEAEKAETYSKSLEKYRAENLPEDKAEAKAKASGQNDKRRVLIETRGEGGYVVAPPSPGYKFLQGSPETIPTISADQRALLWNISQSFNELELEEQEVKKAPSNSSSTYVSTGLSTFEDYNQRGDVIGLLESKGYRVVRQVGKRVEILRPGQTDSKQSGNFHLELRTLRIFSESTEFSTKKAYNPVQVYALLECNNNYSEASKKLYEAGYGERRGALKEIKTELIKVEIVNNVNRESSVISSPGDTLKIENVETAIGSEACIYSPGAEAQEEVLRAIALIQPTGKRIYISEAGAEVRDYAYQLKSTLDKYGSIQETKGELSERDIHSLTDELVVIGKNLQSPIDRDRYRKAVVELTPLMELGITEESLKATEESLRYKEEEEAEAKKLRKVLAESLEEIGKGNNTTALKKLTEITKEIHTGRGKDLLPPPATLEGELKAIAETPPAFKTGYASLDSIVGFTPGAITLICGRPSHGKTTVMFNLFLQMGAYYRAEGYKFYFITYEEPATNISIKLLNRLTGIDLSSYFIQYPLLSKRTNYEFIKAYIKEGRTDIAEIERAKNIYGDMLSSGVITLIDRSYTVEQLYSLISYLSKQEKVGAVFIDYIQRMSTDRKTNDKRTEIAHISDQVLQIAKETKIPIILGAQLNRGAGGKSSKPSLENLKEAGNLEEDANTVISVYNESREKEENEEGESYAGKREVELELKALKNREGEANAKAVLIFDKYTGVVKEKVIAIPTGDYFNTGATPTKKENGKKKAKADEAKLFTE